MNTCDTCKHWGPNRNPDRERRKVKINGAFAMGACRNMLLYTPVCHLDEEPAGATPDTSKDVAFVTGPKFGCVHWEGE